MYQTKHDLPAQTRADTPGTGTNPDRHHAPTATLACFPRRHMLTSTVASSPIRRRLLATAAAAGAFGLVLLASSSYTQTIPTTAAQPSVISPLPAKLRAVAEAAAVRPFRTETTITQKETTITQLNTMPSTTQPVVRPLNMLMGMTSHDTLGHTGRKTGFWLEEFCAPYYTFLDVGGTVTVASPTGGEPPLAPKRNTPEGQTDLTCRWKKDPKTQAVLASTTQLSDGKTQDYDAIFSPGGHGPMWDLAANPISHTLIETFDNADNPAVAICHSPAAWHHTMFHGAPIGQGKYVTGFTNTEEKAVHPTERGPFPVEDERKRPGGHFKKVADWQHFAVVDGHLITGQNPASATAAAQERITLLASVPVGG